MACVGVSGIGFRGLGLGLCRDDEKLSGNYYIVYWGYIGIMEKKMETAIQYNVVKLG